MADEGCRAWLILWTLSASLVASRAFLSIPEFLEAGVCAQVSLMKDFQPAEYEGVWFDIQRVPNDYQQAVDCVLQTYSWTGTAMNVTSWGLSPDGEPSSQEAILKSNPFETATNDEANANLYVEAANTPDAPYKILWTDYSSVACIYSCLDYINLFKAEFMWILSRQWDPSKPEIQKCLKIFSRNNLTTDKLATVIQGEKCPYFKEIENARSTESSVKNKSAKIVTNKSSSFESGSVKEEDTSSFATTDDPPALFFPPPELVKKEMGNILSAFILRHNNMNNATAGSGASLPPMELTGMSLSMKFALLIAVSIHVLGSE